jgi:prepilin signal peptidase PulO-like enzyme (type II secretory pathway)
MPPSTTPFFGALFFGLCAFAIFPLASAIPARLERQWASEIEAYAVASSVPKDYSLSLAQKAIVILVAALLGFTVFSIYREKTEATAFTFYYFSLLLLVAINLKSSLLPDMVVLPTLWVGLTYSATTGLAAEHIYGAVAGYLGPYLVGLAFKMFTGKEVIGRGDLKALSMAGAWFGVSALPSILAVFAVGFTGWALAMGFFGQKKRGFVCTGPAHLIASIAITLGVTAL